MSLIAISTDERLLSYLGGIILGTYYVAHFLFQFLQETLAVHLTGILQNIARAIA